MNSCKRSFLAYAQWHYRMHSAALQCTPNQVGEEIIVGREDTQYATHSFLPSHHPIPSFTLSLFSSSHQPLLSFVTPIRPFSFLFFLSLSLSSSALYFITYFPIT